MGLANRESLSSRYLTQQYYHPTILRGLMLSPIPSTPVLKWVGNLDRTVTAIRARGRFMKSQRNPLPLSSFPCPENW